MGQEGADVEYSRNPSSAFYLMCVLPAARCPSRNRDGGRRGDPADLRGRGRAGAILLRCIAAAAAPLVLSLGRLRRDGRTHGRTKNLRCQRRLRRRCPNEIFGLPPIRPSVVRPFVLVLLLRHVLRFAHPYVSICCFAVSGCGRKDDGGSCGCDAIFTLEFLATLSNV